MKRFSVRFNRITVSAVLTLVTLIAFAATFYFVEFKNEKENYIFSSKFGSFKYDPTENGSIYFNNPYDISRFWFFANPSDKPDDSSSKPDNSASSKTKHK